MLFRSHELNVDCGIPKCSYTSFWLYPAFNRISLSFFEKFLFAIGSNLPSVFIIAQIFVVSIKILKNSLKLLDKRIIRYYSVYNELFVIEIEVIKRRRNRTSTIMN